MRAPLLPFATLSLLLSCAGPEAPPPRTSPHPVTPIRAEHEKPAPVVRMARLDVDPVVLGLGRTSKGPGTAEDVTRAASGMDRLCDESLATANALLAEIRALDAKPDAELTWPRTVGALDRVRLAMKNAGDFPALMAVAHPDETVREHAKACEPKVDKLETSLWLDPVVARVIKRYAGRRESLPAARARLLEHVLRDFRRNGLDLDAAGQKHLRELNENLTKLSQDFDANLAASHLTVQATPAQLDGLPKEWLASHKADANGKVELTTDYPDYFPVLTYAKDRRVALELYKQFDNRAADTNVKVIEKLIELRHEKAKLLGYATWADYVVEPRMAKNAKTVATFLEGLRQHIAQRGRTEMSAFRAMHVRLGGKASDPIPPSDRLYLEDQVRQAKWGLDSKEVSQYFEVSRVKKGLLEITSRLYQIEYRPSDAPTWHPDVEAVDVVGKDGKALGRFYFDLYPRGGKFKHAAVFAIRETVKGPNGERLLPVAAIECNFPKPSAGAPALMSHQDAVTFFHEFGHVLHHVLSQSELATFSGTNVVQDFVESPSQMFEEWAWSKQTLDLFARHYQTDAPIPPALFAKMTSSRSFGRALATERQLFLAALDQAYHTRTPPLDTTRILAEINDAYTPFKYVPGTHFQASFGHLIGYDAGYYGYQWALSIAQDLFTRFQKEGMLNETAAAAYRASILEPGGSADANELVTKFLGRPPSDAAYRAFLLK